MIKNRTIIKTNIMEEIYSEIKGLNGLYQISNFGNVKSISRKVTNGRGSHLSKERILKSTKSPSGELIIGFKISGVSSYFRIAELVAKNFMGYDKETMSTYAVRHKDKDKSNNAVSNLKIISEKEDRGDLTSKYKGVVVYIKGTVKYKGKQYWTKNCKTEEEANTLRLELKERLYNSK